MSARDYRAKFGAYHAYLASGRYERDYDGGFPTILVVTADNAAEDRIARAVRAAEVGRGTTLPLLLTCPLARRGLPQSARAPRTDLAHGRGRVP